MLTRLTLQYNIIDINIKYESYGINVSIDLL